MVNSGFRKLMKESGNNAATKDHTLRLFGKPFVHIPERMISVTMTVRDLNSAFSDLTRIRLIFSLVVSGEKHSEEWWTDIPLQSWSYKPAPQGRRPYRSGWSRAARDGMRQFFSFGGGAFD
jgi:hypothetical protein